MELRGTKNMFFHKPLQEIFYKQVDLLKNKPDFIYVMIQVFCQYFCTLSKGAMLNVKLKLCHSLEQTRYTNFTLMC